MFLDVLLFSSGGVVFGICYWKRLHFKLKFAAILFLLLSPAVCLTYHSLFSFNFVAMGLVLFSLTAALFSKFVICGALFVSAFFFDHNCFVYALPLITFASARSFNFDFIRSAPYEPSIIFEIVGRGKLGLLLSKSLDFAAIVVSVLVPAFIYLFPFLQHPSSLLELFASLYFSPARSPLPLNMWTIFASDSANSG